VEASVYEVEQLLKTEFHLFVQSSERRLSVYRSTSAYQIPEDVNSILDFILGIHDLPPIKGNGLKVTTATEAVQIEPDVVKKLYSINNLTSTHPNNGQAVAEFEKDFFSYKDLQIFFNKFEPSLAGYNVSTVLGADHPLNPGTEANLDVQYIMGIGGRTPTTVYNINKMESIYKGMMDWLAIVSNQTNPPLVHSVSYGNYGASFPSNYSQRTNTEFQKLGTQGVSILFASGDIGVGCSGKRFEPTWPNSPYITMVGSTQFDGKKEIGASFSSGGFSNDFPLLDFQKAAVEHYLNTTQKLPPQKFYNSSGRAYPDISTVGVSVAIIQDGEVSLVDGTSCSSPILAGIIALLNDMRLSQNKSSLGFLNPLLYSWANSTPSAFQDVLSGSNPYGGCPGFPAAPGWDAVTGLGTPNVTTWVDLVSKLN